MDRPRLGTFLSFNAIAKKRRLIVNRGSIPPEKPPLTIESVGGAALHDVWSIWTRGGLGETRNGMYIGYRTIKDGVVRYIGEEVGNAFFYMRSHEVWLFVVDDRTNPIHVFPEDTIPNRDLIGEARDRLQDVLNGECGLEISIGVELEDILEILQLELGAGAPGGESDT
jgi:hypothetical protein